MAEIPATALGSMLGMLIGLCLVPWLILNVTFISTRPAESMRRMINIGLWIAAWLVFTVAHGFQADHARRHADAALAALRDYRTRTGKWPPNLAEVNIDSNAYWSPHLSYYRYSGGGIELTYEDDIDLNPFGWTFYDYDFKKKEWRHVRD